MAQEESAIQDVEHVVEGVAGVLGLNLQDALQRGVKSLAVVIVAWIAYRCVKGLTKRLQAHFDKDVPDPRGQRAETIISLLNSTAGVAIAIAAILTVLSFFVAIGPLLAGVGVAGLAISFGAQSLVKDIISGFFIVVENQFGVDDIVEINGKAGVVERMTLRVVMLRDVEGVLHIIPNGSITVVSNRTREWSRAVLDVGVAYKENVDDVIRVMRDVGKQLWEDREWQVKLTEEPAVWGVEALGDSSVNIRLVASTQPGRQWEVRRELRRRIKNRFDAEGIEIPFPQRTVHVRESAALFEAVSRRIREPAP